MKDVRHTHVVAAWVTGFTLVAASLAIALTRGEFPAPFFWLDVGVVYFLAALPLAATLAAAVLGIAGSWRGWCRLLTIELVVLLAVPQLYVYARTQNDIGRAIELIQQSRFGEARQLVRRTLGLSPRAVWNGAPISNLSANIDETIVRLESTVSRPLAADAIDQQYFERAQALAMLGRTNAALSVLDASPTLANDAEAGNLRGTIFETRRQWQAAYDWYAKSKSAWQSEPDSTQKAGGLSRAIRGVAFCERKLGRLREAEAAWLELLALAPTAESHFLVAQFYEDTQQTSKADFHARQAIKLDSNGYGGLGHKLLNNLVTTHFGCVGVLKNSESLTR